MTDTSGTAPSSVSRQTQPDAPVEALLRLAQSARDFLQYQSIYAEGAEAKKNLLLKEAEIRKKDEKIEELESAITVFNLGGQREVVRMKLEKVEMEKEKKDLVTKLKLALKEKDDVANKLSTTQIEVREYATYTENLRTLDPDKISKDMARIWDRTYLLVTKYFFSLDILTETIEEHDKWIQHACCVSQQPSGSIRIPPTNSFAAKLARRAVMLNVFALVFVQWIFTATPWPLAQAGLDNILSELNYQDERKEALFRAILLSAPSACPSEDREFQRMVKGWLEPFSALLPAKSRTEYKSDVKNLMTEASSCWVKSRCSRQKIIATLDYDSCPESWKDCPVPSHKHQQNISGEASDPEDEDEVTFVAFPAIITMQGVTPKTIHHGFLVRFSHLYGAETEWQSEHKNRRFSLSGVPSSLPGLLPRRGVAGPIP